MSAAGARLGALAGLLPALIGCGGVQSALDPAGPAAREIAALWWAMLAGAVVIFALVAVALLLAIAGPRKLRERVRPERLIVFGGIVLPVVVLSALVPFNVIVSAGTTAAAPPDALTIRIEGRQWWWHIEYDDGRAGSTFVTANELYLPVGEPVELVLTSDDVIHSLWIPRLAGKLDLIPGHTNRMMIEADRPGRFRGQCAEFCGAAHTRMALYVVAVAPERFAAWQAGQRDAARPPDNPAAERGAGLFAGAGCAVCHAVRGHGAWGRTGPDLTHVGSRLTIGAGLLETSRDNLELWIAHNGTVKPGNRMPDYADLHPEALAALAAYLEGLE